MKTPKNSSRPALLLILGALLSALPVVRADDAAPSAPPSPEARREHREKMGERIAEKLGLSDDQKAKWKAIDQQEKSELDALKANTSLSKEDRRAQFGTIRQKYKGQRDALLTPEQKTKADQMRERFEERRKDKDGDAK